MNSNSMRTLYCNLNSTYFIIFFTIHSADLYFFFSVIWNCSTITHGSPWLHHFSFTIPAHKTQNIFYQVANRTLIWIYTVSIKFSIDHNFQDCNQSINFRVHLFGRHMPNMWEKFINRFCGEFIIAKRIS
jgi:hypothetical protein